MYCPKKVAVIGGGYVGLYTAVHIAKKLSDIEKVTIVDIDEDVVRRINSGRSEELHVKEEYIIQNWDKIKEKIVATSDYHNIQDAEVVFIAVQTPRRGECIDYSPLKTAGEKLAEVFRPQKLIISLTTIYPGGTWEYIGKPLESRGYALGKDFYLAHAPERINPGSKDWTIENIPRVVGGADELSLEKTVEFFKKCLELDVHPVSDIRIAEASKLLENSFRFLNIAFINELKRLLERKGIDVKEVVRAASTKPFGFMPFYPGPYIGGPCLPKDSLMFGQFSNSTLLRIAHQINEEQPYYYARKILERIKENKARKVLFLGVGYKPGAYTAAFSPVLKVIEALQELKRTSGKNNGIEIRKYDPNIPKKSDFKSLEEAAEWADIIIVWDKELETGLTSIRKPLIRLSDI